MKELLEKLRTKKARFERYLTTEHLMDLARLISYCCGVEVDILKAIYSHDFRIAETLITLNKIFEDNMCLMQRYYKGIGKVSEELYNEVYDIYGSKCYIDKCICTQTELHHVVGIRRKPWIGNMVFLCTKHHKQPGGVHGKRILYEQVMQEMETLYLALGYTKDERKYLLGTKSGRMFL